MRQLSLLSVSALAFSFISCSPSLRAPQQSGSAHDRVAVKAPVPAATLAAPEDAPTAAEPPASVPVASASASATDTPAEEPLLPAEDTRWGAPKAAGGKAATSGGAVDGAGDSFGAGGLGLSGIGEGGGGTSEGIGLGAVGTIGHGAGTGAGAGVGSGAGSGSGSGFGSGHGRLSGSHATKPPSVRMGAASVGGSAPPGVGALGAAAPSQAFSGIKTGEWDDNANFRDFVKWIDAERAPSVPKLDLRSRRFVVVRDASGKAVPSCAVEVQGGSGASVQLLTTSSGRAILFPFAEGFKASTLTATARCQNATVTQAFDAAAGDGVVTLTLPGEREAVESPTIDIAFVLDTTGSMSEEIDALRDTLGKVAAKLSSLRVQPRVGLVEYKDRGDEYVTRLSQMTTDVRGLEQRITHLNASGGGDTPEHVSEAVRVAVGKLRWRPSSVARLVFLIGDAPPHLDYAGDAGYSGAIADANHQGIQIYTIAASGMDRVGQVVFRQMAQLTGGTHMFVLRGGAGPASTGAGDARSSCGDTHESYTSGDLDELVLSKIQAAIRARDVDPLRIAGLGQDERAKPCRERVVAAQ